MKENREMRFAVLLSIAFVSSSIALTAQAVTGSDEQGQELRFLVYLMRHGVRSPTGKAGQYDRFASRPWPVWDVPPGHLTAHGYKLMTIFGAWDRNLLESKGMLRKSGCADADRVTIFADSDQRTSETGRAIAAGFLPGCEIEVHTLAEGTADPLFHSLEAGIGQADGALAAAAIEGRIGGSVDNLAEAYRPQLAALDRVLAGCGDVKPAESKRTSIFDVPASLAPGSKGHPAELRGPLNTASTLSEILLLEYAEGLPASSVGWGCVDGTSVRASIQLHSAAAEFGQRTPAVARMSASNLLDKIERSIEQAASGRLLSGALSKPTDSALFLVGHDTNIAAVAGALGLNWIIDGRRDDTPPGGALVFELWRSKATGGLTVRVSYTAQTLEQMREARLLTPDNPPARVSVAVPACSGADQSCSLAGFSKAMEAAINSAYVSPVK